jgi:hypothetical protein
VSGATFADRPAHHLRTAIVPLPLGFFTRRSQVSSCETAADAILSRPINQQVHPRGRTSSVFSESPYLAPIEFLSDIEISPVRPPLTSNTPIRAEVE